MGSPTQGWTRACRAVALATVMLSLSCLAHVAGGGVLPGRLALTGVGLLVGAGCAVLTRRRLSPAAILGAMAGGQLLLHEILMAMAAPPATMSTHAGMASSSGLATPTAAMRDGSVRMLVWHAVAAIVLTGLLAFAEDVLWRLWCRLTPASVHARMRALVVPQAAGGRPTGTVFPLRLRVLLSMNPRRGPPAGLTV